MKTNLEKLRDYFAGDADEQTRQEIREQLRRPDSAASKFLAKIAATSRQWLGGVSARDVAIGKHDEAWLDVPIFEEGSKPSSTSGWAVILAVALIRHASMHVSGRLTRDGAVSFPAGDLLLGQMEALFESGDSVSLVGTKEWLHLSVVNGNIRLRAGRSPADSFEHFSIEFRHGDRTVLSIASLEGSVMITPQDFERAVAGRAGTIRILIAPPNLEAK